MSLPGDDKPLDDENGGGGTSPVFIAGLFVPTIVDDEGVPIRASDLGTAPRDGDAAVMLPSGADVGGWWDDQYRLEVPARLVWTSNVSPDRFGEVIVETEDTNWSWLLQEPSGTVEADLNDLLDIRETTAPNLFRPTGLTLRVSFEDSPALSKVAPEEEMRSHIPYATPNQSAVYWEQLVSVASEVYDRGVDAADKVTRVDLGEARKYARLLGYAQVAHVDLLTEGDLLRDAAFEGMSAFEEPIAEARDLSNALGQPVKTTLAGPVVGFHDPPNADSVGAQTATGNIRQMGGESDAQ